MIRSHAKPFDAKEARQDLRHDSPAGPFSRPAPPLHETPRASTSQLPPVLAHVLAPPKPLLAIGFVLPPSKFRVHSFPLLSIVNETGQLVEACEEGTVLRIKAEQYTARLLLEKGEETTVLEVIQAEDVTEVEIAVNRWTTEEGSDVEVTFTMSKPPGRILTLTLDVKKTSGFDWYLFDHFKAYMRTWSRVNKFKATISPYRALPIPPPGVNLERFGPIPDDYRFDEPSTWMPKPIPPELMPRARKRTKAQLARAKRDHKAREQNEQDEQAEGSADEVIPVPVKRQFKGKGKAKQPSTELSSYIREEQVVHVAKRDVKGKGKTKQREPQSTPRFEEAEVVIHVVKRDLKGKGQAKQQDTDVTSQVDTQAERVVPAKRDLKGKSKAKEQDEGPSPWFDEEAEVTNVAKRPRISPSLPPPPAVKPKRVYKPKLKSKQPPPCKSCADRLVLPPGPPPPTFPDELVPQLVELLARVGAVELSNTAMQMSTRLASIGHTLDSSTKAFVEGLEGLLEGVDTDEVATQLVPDSASSEALETALGRIVLLEERHEELEEKNKEMEDEIRSLRIALARVGDGAIMKRPFDNRDHSEESSRTTETTPDQVLRV